MLHRLSFLALLLTAACADDPSVAVESDLDAIETRLVAKAPSLDADDVSLSALFPKATAPVDPWGHAYEVYPVSGGFEIASYGADGRFGGSGGDADIVRYVRRK
jgi:hypothetical protein